MQFFFLLFLTLSFTISGFGGIGDWKTYTSHKQIRSIFKQNNLIWAATSGGVFNYNFTDSSYKIFTTLDGLKNTDITSIVADKSGSIWIGSSNGYIHNFNPQKSKWVYYNDIYFTNATEKRINNFSVYGDSLFICTPIGVHVLSILKSEFGDSYTKFGLDNQITGKVNSVLIQNDTIWVATNDGVASAWRRHPNLAAPQSWSVYKTPQGLPSNRTSTILLHNGKIFAATSNGLSYLEENIWRPVNSTSGKNIVAAFSSADNLYFITQYELYKFSNDEVTLIENQFPSLLASLIVNDTQIFVGTTNHGVQLLQNSSLKSIIPAGPPTNNLIGLAIDEQNNLWAGTGTSNGQGFVRFDGKIWHHYHEEKYPVLFNPNYYRVDIGYNNTKWVSGWGHGVALLGNDNQIIKVFNTTNGLPPTFVNNPTYVVIAGVATDPDGNAWINVRTGRGDTLLAVYRKDSTFSYIKTPSSSFSFISTGITIDQNRTKWLYTEINGGGLFFYCDSGVVRGTLPNSNWGKITKANGLSSDNISVVDVDNDGEIWAGTTDAGINIIYDARNPLNRIAPYNPLRGQKINDILVDPTNQKWVATPQGVFVLNQDGTTITAQYTFESTNGKLLDNNVQSLVMNRKNGTVYFGTEKGMSALQTAAATPVQTMEQIIISPNPFEIPSSSMVTFDGLVANSSIKILTIDGTLLRELTTPGGRVGIWDGRDSNGELVSTGIYIVVAYNDDGSEVGLGKIVVVKK
ncbi:MAG: two-component regulator propeller domain-containing protein [Bacteroidota bacterium]|nr:two-component regulator propeller domain-containing protein [Bacteroidota bacterium]